MWPLLARKGPGQQVNPSGWPSWAHTGEEKVGLGGGLGSGGLFAAWFIPASVISQGAEGQAKEELREGQEQIGQALRRMDSSEAERQAL